MITRLRSLPHTCLRCQRSLDKRYASSKAHDVSEAAISSPETISQFQSSSVGQDSRRPDEEYAVTIRRTGVRAPSSRLSQYPLGKLHGRHGRRLREKREVLDADASGKSAKVIVLRESNLNFYHWNDKIADEDVQHVDILSQLQDERGLVGRDEVEQNISALKPQQGQEPRTWDDWNKLVQILQEGFTSTQLARYLESYRRSETEYSGNELGAKTVNATKLSATTWKPGVSELRAQFDSHPLRGYMLQSHTTKQKQVMMILRTCWGFGLPGVEEGVGQFEVNVTEKNQILLSKGSPSRLSLLLKEYLAGDSETLELFPARGMLRVTTLQHKRDIILQLLEAELSSIRRETLFLAPLFHSKLSSKNSSAKSPKIKRSFERWMNRNFSESTLQELGRLTNTDIVRSSKDTVLISSTNNDSTSKLSTRNDLVRRLLLTLCDTADRAHSSLECNTVKNELGTFVPYSRLEGLDWHERMRDWTRWTTPTAKASLPEDEPVGAMTNGNSESDKDLENEIEGHFESIRHEERSVKDTNLASWWDQSQLTESSALFGSVLHCPFESQSASDESSLPKWSSSFSTFSTLAPNISRILKKAQLRPVDNLSQSTVQPTTYLNLRFLPNPFQLDSTDPCAHINESSIEQGSGNELLKILPSIEMRFAVCANTRSVDLKEVVAVMDETRTDTMLPSNGIDIRWQKKTIIRLKRNSDAIAEFVQNSIFDIYRQDLRTPPSLEIPIDAALCKGGNLHLLGLKGAAFGEINYLFAGLDVRKTLVFNYKGWRLLYTNIEAGRAGGHRGELKLRPILNGKVSTGKQFTQAAYHIAQELGSSEIDAIGGTVGSVYNVDIGNKKLTIRTAESRRGKTAKDKESSYWSERIKIPLTNEDVENETLLGDGIWEAEGRVNNDHSEELANYGNGEDGHLQNSVDDKPDVLDFERHGTDSHLP